MREIGGLLAEAPTGCRGEGSTPQRACISRRPKGSAGFAPGRVTWPWN